MNCLVNGVKLKRPAETGTSVQGFTVAEQVVSNREPDKIKCSLKHFNISILSLTATESFIIKAGKT